VGADDVSSSTWQCLLMLGGGGGDSSVTTFLTAAGAGTTKTLPRLGPLVQAILCAELEELLLSLLIMILWGEQTEMHIK